MTSRSSLRQINEVALKIHSIFSRGRTLSAQPTSDVYILPLDLCSPPREAFREELISMSLDTSSVDSLILIYEEKCKLLQKAFQHEYEKSAKALQQLNDGDHEYNERFRRLSQLKYGKYVELVQAEMVRAIRGARARFQLDANNTTDDDFDTSSSSDPDDDGPPGRRGHRYSAVQILEQAYQHTPNITQAEKYKLAEATKLEPRQVTIWFQNRRNRKAKKEALLAAQAQATAAHLREISPEPAFCLSKPKRKTAQGLGLGLPAVSDAGSPASSCASKKRRTSRLASDESTTSTSTVGTFDSSCTYDSLGSHNAWSISSVSSYSSASSDDSCSQSSENGTHNVNVFRRLSQRQLSAEQQMPDVTMDTEEVPTRTHFASPLESSTLSGAFKFQPHSPTPGQNAFGNQSLVIKQERDDAVFDSVTGNARLDLADLRIDPKAFGRQLGQGLAAAFSFSTPSSRNVSSSSMVTPANHEDDWMDEDELTRAPRRPRKTQLFDVDATPTRLRYNASTVVHNADCTPRPTHQPLFQATSSSAQSATLSPAEERIFNSIVIGSPSFNQQSTQTGDEEIPMINLDFDLAELEEFLKLSNSYDSLGFTGSNDGSNQYTMSFDPQSSTIFCPVPSGKA